MNADFLAEVQYSAGVGIALTVMLAVLLLFATLTVTVTNSGLLASFGIGLVRVQADEQPLRRHRYWRPRRTRRWRAQGVTGAVICTGLQPPVARLTDQAFEVRGGIYSDTVAYSVMPSVTVEDSKAGMMSHMVRS